jgi:hypothetical protein
LERVPRDEAWAIPLLPGVAQHDHIPQLIGGAGDRTPVVDQRREPVVQARLVRAEHGREDDDKADE